MFIHLFKDLQTPPLRGALAASPDFGLAQPQQPKKSIPKIHAEILEKKVFKNGQKMVFWERLERKTGWFIFIEVHREI